MRKSRAPKAPGPTFDYFGFELLFRGDPAEIKERLRVHVARFAGRGDILDLGSGRGEFLELLGEAGIRATGVDADADMVAACVARGLQVTHGDVIAYLDDLADESLGGIFAAHLIEHLAAPVQLNLIELCRRKLRPGSPIVLETPNPLCVGAFPTQMTLDPTHEHLLHPELLRFLLSSSGFDRVEVVYLQPWPETGRLGLIGIDPDANASERRLTMALNRNFARLNAMLFGAQDFAAVGRKRSAEVAPATQSRRASRRKA